MGDFYASGMDEAGIAAAGLEPLRPYLDRIDALASAEDLRALNLEFHRAGFGALFGIGVEADFEDAEAYLAYLGQAGLGLPERGYYLNDDERSVALRERLHRPRRGPAPATWAPATRRRRRPPHRSSPSSGASRRSRCRASSSATPS